MHHVAICKLWIVRHAIAVNKIHVESSAGKKGCFSTANGKRLEGEKRVGSKSVSERVSHRGPPDQPASRTCLARCHRLRQPFARIVRTLLRATTCAYMSVQAQLVAASRKAWSRLSSPANRAFRTSVSDVTRFSTFHRICLHSGLRAKS